MKGEHDMRIFKNEVRKQITNRVSMINKDNDKCRKYERLLFEAAVYLAEIGEKQMSDLFNDSIETHYTSDGKLGVA
jgi:hypothetical protein